MVRRPWALVIGIGCATVARPADATAAEAEASAAFRVGGDETVGEPEAISPSQIGEEADRAKTRLEGIRNRTEHGPSLAPVNRELPSIAARIKDLEAEVPPSEIEELSDRELEDLTFAWDHVGRRIKALQARLGDESDRFEAERTRVATMIERWKATGEDPDITPAAAQQVDKILHAAEAVDAKLRDDLDVIYDAQARVSANGLVVTRRLADLAGAQEALRARILSRTDPLWQVDPRRGPSAARLAVRTLVRQLEQVVVFVSGSLGALASLLVFWLASWALLSRLARLPRDGATLTLESRSALQRPRSASLVLAVASFALLGPPVPWVLRQALWLLILPALLRLLTPTPYRSVALVFAGPLVLSLLSEVIPETSALARWAHLVVSITGLLAAMWVGRWRRNEALRGLGIKALRIAEGLLVLSILANILGWGGLPPVVNHATMFGIYVAVLIVACIGVARALVTISVRTDLLRRSRAILHKGDRISERASVYLGIAGWILWVIVVADGFGIADPVWRSVKLWMELPWEIGAFSLAPGDLLAFGLTLYAALLGSRFLGFVLDEDVLPRLNLARGLPPTISMLIRYFVLGVGFLVAAAAAGVELDKLSLLVGAFGVGIGFGLQNVVNNFVSGLILMFERPVKVGDTVEVGDLLGEVTHIGIRASRLRTLQGAEVIVPNANLISEEVINWTLSDRRRRFEVEVGVKYGTPPEEVLPLLEDVAKRNDRVLSHPAPRAWFMGFGDSSLDFQLLVWTGDFDDWRGVRSEITVAVNRAIVDAGIEIPFPQRDLHVRSVAGELLRRARGETPDPPDAEDGDET